MTVSKCKSCGADLVWIVAPSGKPHPLDAAAVTMWLVEPDGSQGGSPRGKPIQVRSSHFASCPQAEQWRGNR